ncbi:MAG: hypothetical protein WAV47_16275, partial [Blastocatellia bacterium]
LNSAAVPARGRSPSASLAATPLLLKDTHQTTIPFELFDPEGNTPASARHPNTAEKSSFFALSTNHVQEEL